MSVLSRIWGYGSLDNKNVLDCGCGLGKLGFLMRVDFGMMMNYRFYSVGVDIFPPNIQFCKDHKVYDDLVLCDAKSMPFKENIFDITLASEILEHFEKKDGKRFISELERVSRGLIVISTPNTFFQYRTWQNNVYQKHRSSWSTSELRNMGFKVVGIGSKLRIFSKPYIFWAFSFLFSKILSVFSYIIPQLGEDLLAFKHKEDLY